MPLGLRLESNALDDLDSVCGYIAEASDEITAERFGNRIFKRCEALRLAPRAGAPYSRRRGIRKINESPYKIFYRVTEKEVIILRIWDGRRGIDPHLGGPS